MWLCRECLNESDEPDRERTSFEDFYGVSHLFPDSHYFDMLKCPHCGSDEIEEMKKCDVCEAYFREDDLQDTTEAVNGGVGYACEQCIEDCDIVFI